jgi:hypothetical protein
VLNHLIESSNDNAANNEPLDASHDRKESFLKPSVQFQANAPLFPSP